MKKNKNPLHKSPKKANPPDLPDQGEKSGLETRVENPKSRLITRDELAYYLRVGHEPSIPCFMRYG